jgi:hypothetical protein
MTSRTRAGLAWCAALLLVPLALAAALVPGLSRYVPPGARSAPHVVLDGVGLIVLGLTVIGLVIRHRRHALPGARRH